MPCQAVLFDAGHTLLHVHPSVGAVYSAVAARHGITSDPEAVETSFRRVWTNRIAQENARPSSDAIERQWWREIVSKTFAELDQGEQFGDRFEVFFRDLFDAFAEPMVWRLYPDVYPALEILKQRGIRCAIVSNWDSRLPSLIAGLGVAGYFEFILTSAEAGERKPGSKIFQEALGRLGLTAADVIHVGDSETDDVGGALRAGVKPILLDREASAERPDEITSIRSLFELVSQAPLC